MPFARATHTFGWSCLMVTITTSMSLGVFAQAPDAPAEAAAQAGDNGGTVVTQPKPEPTTDEAKTVRQRVDEWLATKGWKRGRNKDRSYVASSAATYELANKQWAVVRSNAFQAALLDAKRKLAESLSADVSATVASAIRRGGPAAAEDGQPKDIVETMLDLANKEKVEASELGTQTNFGRAVRVLCRAEVAGSQVVKVFDDRDSSGNGALAVVVRWTPLGTDVVETVLGRRKEKVTAPDVSAVDVLNTMSVSELDSLFGARIMREADGEACVVAFGQADVLGRTEAAVGAAERVAAVDALGNLRQFVGELVACEQILDRRSSINDIVDAEPVFKSDEAFTEMCRSEMKGLQFQGAEEFKTWEGQTDGKLQTVGVVKKWTVSSATEANELRRRFASLAPSRGGSGRRDIGVEPKQPGAAVKPQRPAAPAVQTRPESPDLD